MTGRPASLRRQLAWAFMALALLVALGQATFVYVTGNRAEEAMIDEIAAEQLRLSMAQYPRDPVLAQPNTPSMRLFVSGGGTQAALPDYLRALPREVGAYEVHPGDDVEYHVAVGRDGDLWFYLVYDVGDHERRQRNVMAVLAISVIAIALIVMAVGDRLARRLTRDLERLSSAVRGAASAAAPAAASDSRFLDLARHAETFHLAEALDEHRRRLSEALARERAFSAAASHELRTPLMRASSTVELLRAGEASARQRERLDLLQASLTEITMLTAGLLRVARGTTREAVESVDLPGLVDEVVGHLGREARARGVAIETGIAGGTRVQADRGALWIVLGNLLRNAIRHSDAKTVWVEWAAGRLAVRDDGRGFDTGRGPGLRSTAAEGSGADAAGRDGSLGLGLSIVERVCEAAGWQLAIDSDADGTRVAVMLPEDGAAAP